MKETITWTECLEKKGGLLSTTALIWALSLLSPSEWLAQNVGNTDEEVKITEVTQSSTRVDVGKTISLGDAIRLTRDWLMKNKGQGWPWIEANLDPEWGDEWLIEWEENLDDEGTEKIERSFTFKPISIDVWVSTVKNWEDWADWITTKMEFAWWWKNTSLYGYVRKDWNKYAKWFNEWMELFANESVKLWKNLNLNGKQFYRWNGAGKMILWPQVSINTQIWNVWLWSSAWVYAAYDILPWQENKVSWSWIVSVNISVEQGDWRKWTWDAFIHLGWVKDLSFEGASTYWEANLQTPNLLDSEKIWALCWWIFARYWWDLKSIKFSCLWFWATCTF